MAEENDTTTSVLDQVQRVRDALTVRRVFGEPYELDGVTVIPVARVSGGAGGGGGQGQKEGEDGSGFGTGFGLDARPLGVYEVREGHVEWKPAIDVNRIVRGGQIIGGLFIICLALALSRRR